MYIIYLYCVSLVLIAAISIIFDSKSSTQSPKKPNWAYELMSLMLKDTPKYRVSKDTTLPTKLDGSKKKMTAQ